MINSLIEEALEHLYACEVEDATYPEEESILAAMGEASSAGLVEFRDGRYRLTRDGQAAGGDVVRRHRLAERLLSDVLAVAGEHMPEDACRFEHVLQHGLDDKICILLGHPSTCPHGKPIPRGKCCRKARGDRIEEISLLCDGKPGAKGVVAYLTTRDDREVQKLMAMGILPGSPIQLIRRFPSYVFQVGYSQFTVDRPLAAVIYVHWESENPPQDQKKG
ncbi:MAG: transcriptional regulator [Actinobacteria bacterium]|nr:transcriptional regulator [Actinomycetota bacterium]